MPGSYQPIRFDLASLRYLSRLGRKPHTIHGESSGFGYQSGIPLCIAPQRLESTLSGPTTPASSITGAGRSRPPARPDAFEISRRVYCALFDSDSAG